MKNKFKYLMVGIATIVPTLLFPSIVSASVGIGMSCGCQGFNIGTVERNSTIYIGQICILNTGTQEGWYKMDVAYQLGQTELQVPADWITFEPQRFYLYPAPKPLQFPYDYSQKIVQVYMTVPSDPQAGDCFCYLEGCTDFGTYVGAAVASELRFRLPAIAPTVATDTATTVNRNTVILNGNVTATGGIPVIVRGFQWGTRSSQYSSDWHETGSFGVGTFGHNINRLVAGRTYYYRAYATNSVETTYGNEQFFTTKGIRGFNFWR